MFRIFLVAVSILTFANCQKKLTDKPKRRSVDSDKTSAAGLDSPATFELGWRKLTNDQFIQTMTETLGPVPFSTPLPESIKKDALVALATINQPFTIRSYELTLDTAWEIASNFSNSPEQFKAIFPCSCEAANRQCMETGLPAVGAKLFNETKPNLDRYFTLFDTIVENYPKEIASATPAETNCEAVKSVIAGMLSSYRAHYLPLVENFERNDGIEEEDKAILKRTIANQLSYFLWGGPPNSELLAYQLDDFLVPDKLAKIIDKMLKDRRFLSGMQSLFADWLSVTDIEQMASSDDERAALAASSIAEFENLVMQSSVASNFLETFFNSKEALIDDVLAETYGSADTGEITLPENRSGFLTRTAFLMQSGANDSSPTKRGHFIRKHLLCQDIPSPPPTLNTVIPESEDKYSLIAGRINNESCTKCHVLMDPIGLGFEAFGPNGQNRENPDLASFGLSTYLDTTPFMTSMDFAQILTQDQRLGLCFALHGLRTLKGEKETSAENLTVAEMTTDWVSKPVSLQAAIKNLLLGYNFLPATEE